MMTEPKEIKVPGVFRFPDVVEVKDTDCLLPTMQKYLNIREQGGNNKGNFIDQWLVAVGIKYPAPWCAAYASGVFNECNISNPNSAWSPSFDTSPLGRTIYNTRDPLPTKYQMGMIFTLYYANLKRVGHVGMITDISGEWATTNEGNVTMAGTRETNEGKDGVRSLKRDIRKMHKIRIYDTQKFTRDSIPGNSVGLIDYNFTPNLQETKTA